jgi:hypothetical protein
MKKFISPSNGIPSYGFILQFYGFCPGKGERELGADKEVRDIVNLARAHLLRLHFLNVSCCAGQGEREPGADKEVYDDDGQHDCQGAGQPKP